MTEYLSEVINPDKPGSFMKDTKENILHDLEHYTLDPVFEDYGNFVYKPTWVNKEAEARYSKGCTVAIACLKRIKLYCKYNLEAKKKKR